MLVSAIIPTYNRSKTIERAINSVLAQTWQEIEIIVVDDGSTDDTEAVLGAYKSKIRVICQKNAGPSAARNTGMKAATGEIISCLDSDDTWLPSKIERQVKLLERTKSSGVVCCVCNARMLFPTGMRTSFHSARLHPTLPEGVWRNPKEILLDSFLLFNQVAAFRRESVEQIGYFREDLRLNEDYEFALRLSLIGPWCFIAEPLVDYYQDTDNMSRAYRQLDKSTHTLRILEDLATSPQFGPMMPQARLQRRLRVLRNKIWVLKLESHKNAFLRLFGRGMLLVHRGFEKIYAHISPPMLTNEA